MPAISTIILIAFNKEVVLDPEMVDNIIPNKQSTNEINDIVYLPFKKSGK